MGEKRNEKDKESHVSKEIEKSEEKQLIWFFTVIILMFLFFILSYIYFGNKRFEYAGVEWRTEEIGKLKVFHSRYKNFFKGNKFHNTYLRNDPRKNNITAKGEFNRFWVDVLYGFDRETAFCRGDFAITVFQLSSYLRYAVGMRSIEIGTNDKEYAKEENKTYVDCENHLDKTVFLFKMSNESKVEQDAKNLNCYTIYVANCTDIKPIEKFIIKSIADFKGVKI